MRVLSGPAAARRSGRGLARRLGCGAGRGAALAELLLAVAVLGVLLSLGIDWYRERQRAALAEEAGREMALLTAAAQDYAVAEYAPLLGTVGAPSSPAPQEVTLAALRAAGVLPAHMDDTDAMKRRLRVLALPRGAGAAADGLRLLVTQQVEAGDGRWPAAAVFEARRAQAMGIVAAGESRLRGPSVDASVADFQGADFDGDGVADGLPAGFALAVLLEVDEEDVCGGQLYRDVSVCPNGAAMATALDMGGRDIVNVGAFGAASLTLSGGLSVLDELTVAGGLTVDRSVEIDGAARVAGALSTDGEAVVAGALRAASLTAVGAVAAGSLEAEGAVAAGSVTVTGAAALGSATATGQLSAASAAFTSLTVGSCTGC